MSVKIVYKDIAVGAAETAAVATTSRQGFSDISQIFAGVEPPATTTCELNGWGLSHDYKTYNNQPIAFWSSVRSGYDCVFTSPPTITILWGNLNYTSTGLSITFAPESNDYCRKITVTWYQDNAVKFSGTYYPNTAQYVINQTVEAFDKIVITFNETNLPVKRCKINGITIGVVREFEADELKNVSAVHEVDLISETVPINVLDAEIRSKDDIDWIFQKKQPIEAYNNGNLIGVYYMEQGQRSGKYDFSISCHDAIGLLDLATTAGGLWIEDTPITTIINEVIKSPVEFEIDTAYKNSTLRGFIEPGQTEREALQQIAFALGAIVDTSATGKIRLFPPPSDDYTAIPPKKTYTGGTVETSDTVTGVTVTANVIFDERPGEDDDAIEFNGVEYRYYTSTKHATNPNTVTSDPENIKTFDKSYLCNLSNAQTLADNIMAYYMRRNKYSFTHVLDGQTPAGRYHAMLPWDDEANGNITKMTITTSNLTVSSTEMLLDE